MIQQFSPEIIDWIVNSYRRDRLGGDRSLDDNGILTSVPTMHLLNNGTDKDAYSVAEAQEVTKVQDYNFAPSNTSPAFKIRDAQFPESLDRLVALPRELKQDVSTSIQISTVRVVRVEEVKSTDQYCMLDPEDTTRMRSSDTGPWSLLSYIDSNREYAIVDTSRASRMWRYELTEDAPSGQSTEGRLVRIDGDYFHSDPQYTVPIQDQLEMFRDQKEGNVGWCVQSGPRFINIQAPCP